MSEIAFPLFPILQRVILQEPKTRSFRDLVSSSLLPSPQASAVRSPACYLNVTFACAVECPDAVGHSLTLNVCLFFTAFMWPNLGETTPCSVVFRGKFLFRHRLGWREKPQSVLDGSHMGLRYALCPCLDSRAVFQAPCWGWCNCRSLGGHSCARVCEALALEETFLPPVLLGFAAGAISRPLGRRACSGNGCSPALFLLWLFQWMKNMWRSDPCYAEYGVDGSTCSFFIYLSEVSGFLCLSGGGVHVCSWSVP